MAKSAHLAQVNIGRIKAPLDSPVLAGFVARLDEIKRPRGKESRFRVAPADR